MAHNHNKIILLLMIKNESKIIERCIGRALQHVDAVCILDTGSTDNTVEICNSFLSASGKPYKVSVEPFKNFGYNRTVSFQKVQELCKELGWDADTTYAMAVDGDMIIKPSPQFKDYKMSLPGYRVIQHNGALKYYNSRFMRCSYDWKCIGGTHEYWSGDPTEIISPDIFYIDDVNDGGCKSDKTERDIRLLKEDLVADFNNARAHFYLAQSYKDCGKFDEAIQHYMKRIKLGGWFEEVWYSHYQIAKCHECLKQPEEMEFWALKAFKVHPVRAEPIYFITKYFREHSHHHKAYYYCLKGLNIPYPNNDLLFVEHDIYNGLFNYEKTILDCYVSDNTRRNALADIIKYINTKQYFIDNVWDNMYFYIEALTSSTYKGEYTKLIFPNVDEYHVSSCSLIPYNNNILINTRYVNYKIEGGNYISKSSDNIIKTKNGFTYLGKHYYPTDVPTMMNEELSDVFLSNVQGLEDLRLFSFNNKLRFTASSKIVSDNGQITMVLGDYNLDSKTVNNISFIKSPYNKSCEKNWIYIPQAATASIPIHKDKMNFIYNWYPYEIGSVNDASELEIHTTHKMPDFFSRVRGSSNLCEFDNKLWCVVHIVRYSNPRVYYHMLVYLNKETLLPEKCSVPFCFAKLEIEYCLGLHIKDGKAHFIFSHNDSNPGLLTIPITNLQFCNIYNN
jgi:tetratricopeptide (TPR) repeat protein